MILVCFMNAKFVKVAAAKSHELRIQHTRAFSILRSKTLYHRRRRQSLGVSPVSFLNAAANAVCEL